MRQGRLEKAFVVDFEEESYSEYNAARIVADRLDLPLERIILSQDDLSDFLEIVRHADEPLADSSALAVWKISSAASRELKVVIGGDGGDELFGGYQTYLATLLHEKLVSGFPAPLRKRLANLGLYIPTNENKVSFSYKLMRFLRAAHLPTNIAHLTWNGTWLPDEAAELVQPEVYSEIVRKQLPEMVSRLGSEKNKGLMGYQLMDIAEYLNNDILPKSDRMSMAHSLEVRSPYLNHFLAEWAIMRPDRQKISRTGSLKTILRHAAYRVYGKEIAYRPKQGFSLPVHTWIRGALSEMVQDLHSNESLSKIEFLNTVRIRKIVDDHFALRKSYGFELWGLLVFVAWYRMNILNTPVPPEKYELMERDINLIRK